MQDALNEQINKEMFSAYLYLSMSSHFTSSGLKGFANWMMVQYKEETDHAMKFYNYLQSQGAEVKLLAIEEPASKWDSPLAAFKATYQHEQFITKSINELADLADSLRDRATLSLLDWYITEQIEEEENDREIIDRLTLIGDNTHGLFMLDKELAQRVYVPLTTAE